VEGTITMITPLDTTADIPTIVTRTPITAATLTRTRPITVGRVSTMVAVGTVPTGDSRFLGSPSIVTDRKAVLPTYN